jgi:hypothetical protein
LLPGNGGLVAMDEMYQDVHITLNNDWVPSKHYRQFVRGYVDSPADGPTMVAVVRGFSAAGHIRL